MIVISKFNTKSSTGRFIFLFIFITILPFFKPIGPCYYENFNFLFKVSKVISIIFITIFLFNNIESLIFDKSIILLFVFWSIYLCNSLVNSVEWFDILNNFITILLFTLYLSAIFHNKIYRVKFMNCLIFIFSMYLILQILSMIFIKITNIALFEPLEGDFIYFLGTDNYSAFATITMISSLFVIDVFYPKKRKRAYQTYSTSNFVLLILLIICYFLTRSMTALVSHLILFFILLFNNKHKIIIDNFSTLKMFIIILVFTFLVVYLKIQNYISFILLNLFKKDLTFNSRFFIWKRSYELIFEKPLLGWGELKLLDNPYMLYGANHAHNFVLELLLKTGIVGTIVFYLYIKENLDLSKVDILRRRCILSCFFAYTILFLMDFYIINIYFYIFIILCNNFIKRYNYVKKNWNCSSKLYKLY